LIPGDTEESAFDPLHATAGKLRSGGFAFGEEPLHFNVQTVSRFRMLDGREDIQQEKVMY
jgi:hypothetical protein